VCRMRSLWELLSINFWFRMPSHYLMRWSLSWMGVSTVSTMSCRVVCLRLTPILTPVAPHRAFAFWTMHTISLQLIASRLNPVTIKTYTDQDPALSTDLSLHMGRHNSTAQAGVPWPGRTWSTGKWWSMSRFVTKWSDVDYIIALSSHMSTIIIRTGGLLRTLHRLCLSGICGTMAPPPRVYSTSIYAMEVRLGTTGMSTPFRTPMSNLRTTHETRLRVGCFKPSTCSRYRNRIDFVWWINSQMK
jgi:hypothetical protein